MADQDQKPTGATGGDGGAKKPPLQAAKLQAAAKPLAAGAKPALQATAAKAAPAKAGAVALKPPIPEADVSEMKRFLLKRTETRTTKWFQIFDADKLDDEQVFGGHLALLGTLGVVMGIYYISGLQINPFNGGPGFYDNWFYLCIKPRLVSLGIDTYKTDAVSLTHAAKNLLWWAGIHFAVGAFFIFGGWRHWTKNLYNPFTGRRGNFRDFNFAWIAGRSAKNYAEAWGAHVIYLGFVFLAWGMVMWLVLKPNSVDPNLALGPNLDFQTIGAENFMAFFWGAVLLGIGFWLWSNPPRVAEHLNDDIKAIFSVHMTAIGYINIALGVIAFVAFRKDQFFYNQLNDLVFYIYGEPFNRVRGGVVENPAFPAFAILPKSGASFGMSQVVINLLAFNHVITGTLYLFGGVFHGGQYLLRIQMSGLYNQIKSKWISLGRDKEFQVKFLGVVMVLCFTTMISVYAVICWNSLCELNQLGCNISMSFYWLRPLPLWSWMFTNPSVNDWCAVHALTAGSLFCLVALARIAFFSHTSPLWEDLGLKKNSFSFPCLGPVYGGTCGVSIQDQLWFAMLWSIKGLSVFVWYIDGGWLASMNYGMAVADCNMWDTMIKGLYAQEAIQAGIDPAKYMYQYNAHYTGGVFYYMWTETQSIWASAHLTVVLLIGHLIWFISFAVWFKDRGSRLEGADIQTRTVRWMGQVFLKRDVKFRFPV
ncbi:MAG: photosystem I reaction center subunit IX, partial [Rhizobacter sp.]|nr:photosystem I reaction center subunit IX [Chlorobiales bacterium]